MCQTDDEKSGHFLSLAALLEEVKFSLWYWRGFYPSHVSIYMNVSSSVNLYVKNFLINFKIKLFKQFVLVMVLLTSNNTAMISLLVCY